MLYDALEHGEVPLAGRLALTAGALGLAGVVVGFAGLVAVGGWLWGRR